MSADACWHVLVPRIRVNFHIPHIPKLGLPGSGQNIGSELQKVGWSLVTVKLESLVTVKIGSLVTVKKGCGVACDRLQGLGGSCASLHGDRDLSHDQTHGDLLLRRLAAAPI